MEEINPTTGEILRESFNLGEWVESRIHLQFTQMTDDMFGYGNLTRDERIALSSAIGDALNAFRSKVESAAPQLYERTPGSDPDDDGDPGQDAPEMDEAAKAEMPIDDETAVKGKAKSKKDKAKMPPKMKEAETPVESAEEQSISEATTGVDVDINESEMIVDLVEKAVRKDSTIPVKIIQSGWGSSGFYAPDVLKRDGPRVFAEGTKMFWNHQTAAQEAEQPEGNLNNLAAVLVSGATWQEHGKAGPGLYADAKVFGPYKEAINELAPYIGVSIRANGRASQGEAAGRKGSVIQEISHAKSIDFVTTPGAGGQIISMFEAARNGKQEAIISDTTPDNGPIQPETGQKVKKMTNAREVNMADLGDVQAQLAEATNKAAQYEQILGNLQDIQAKLKESDTNNARLREAMLVRDAREFVAKELEGKQLPEPTRKRLQETLVLDPPIVDGALDITTYAMKVREAVKTETDYLAAVAGYSGSGNITGMGGNAVVNHDDGKKAQSRLTEAFAGLGLSDTELKYATRIN